MKVRISFSEVVGKRKSKIEVRIPFSEVVGKRKSKIEVRIPFSEVIRKRKTNIEVRFSFTCVVGKRLAQGYTHLKAWRFFVRRCNVSIVCHSSEQKRNTISFFNIFNIKSETATYHLKHLDFYCSFLCNLLLFLKVFSFCICN